MSEKKKHARTSDEDEGVMTTKVSGKEGLERLADFTRRILSTGKVRGKATTK